MLGSISDALAAGFGVTLVGLFITYKITTGSLKSEIADHKNTIADQKVMMAEYKTTVKDLEDVIDKQNKALKDIEVDYNASLVELDEWKNKPAEIRYKTIYEKIPAEVNMTRGNCEDTSKFIDALRGINLN